MALSTLTKRILSALVIAPMALLAIYAGGNLFMASMWLIAVVSIMEWKHMAMKMKRRFTWMLFGLIYIGGACAALIDIRTIIDETAGLHMTLWIMLIVWACDTGAYISGKLIGGPKMVPKISPNKTWAGLIGGVIASALTSFIFMTMVDGPAILIHTLLAIPFAILDQVGDVFISWIKRHVGQKDTGNIIPGHGGILDRIDGLLLVIIAAWLMLRISMPVFFV